MGLINRGRIAGLAVGFVAVALFGPASAGARADTAGPGSARRPNFVFILIDDMRWDVMSCAGHPFVKTPNIDRIATAGVRFGNAFVTTSLCSPSRASFLTGTYAHVHGVRTNGKNDPDPSCPTFPQLLQRAGYETAFIGKWHMGPRAGPRPGFDYWLSFLGQGDYIDPKLDENGRAFQKKGYMTDILTEYAANFLKRDRSKPFCLYLSHKAMHAEFIPAQRHKNLYAPSDLIKPLAWNDDLSDKPRWLRELRLRGGRQKRPRPPDGIPNAIEQKKWDPTDKINTRRINWHRTLAAVDESVGAVLDTLQQTSMADDTVVIFAGDNGFFLGEHGLVDKRLAYEEALRIPLLISGPRVARPGRVIADMALNIDVATTILDLAGVQIPAGMQGRSLKGLLAGEKTPWRQSFFYAYFKEDWLPGIPTIEAVRTTGWKYIRYPEIDDIEELYDLARDPQEMNNLAADPSSADQLVKMRAEMKRLIQATKH